jgi:acetylornithine deacetylase
MKSFIAVCLAKAPDIARRALDIPIHFAFSYDEEVGCIGVRNLLADLVTLPTRPGLCIVGEPTEMRVVVSHKGKKSVRCTVHGKEGHSAMNHRGVNAVEYAAEIVAFLRAMQRRIRREGPFEPGFDPPYTTIHTGLIQGGVALNIVPKDCSFEFEIRNLPSHDPEALMAEVRALALSLVPEMLAVDEAAGISFDETNTTVGLDSHGNEHVADMACALSGGNDRIKVSFTTEAGLFHAAGIPSVVCGPGSIAQAHKPDEFITIEQVALCETFIDRVIEVAMIGDARPL